MCLILMQRPNSIGYQYLDLVLDAGLQVAQMINRVGQVVEPTGDSGESLIRPPPTTPLVSELIPVRRPAALQCVWR
jgi:hypothetical protein